MFKLITGSFFAVILFFLTAGSVAGAEGIDTSGVYSPQFPEAHFEVHEIDRSSVSEPNINALQSSVDESEVVGAVAVEAFVAETYEETADGEIFVKESRLLTKEEVDALGEENFGSLDQVTPSNIEVGVEEYGSLYVEFLVVDNAHGNNNYTLESISIWDPPLIWMPGRNHPADGEEYAGFSWGGGFDLNTSSFFTSVVTNRGNSTQTRGAGSNANGGIVWGFEGLQNLINEVEYPETIVLSTEIEKNVLTGGGNTTTFSFQYTHTYQQINPTISFSLTGIPGFSIGTSENNWDLVVPISGFPY